MKSSSCPRTSARQALRSKACNCSNFSLREVEAAPLDVLVTRHPADRRLLAHGPPAGAVDDPLQHPHVLAETRAR